jgi:5-methyltetrahydrofolate--homocysteine methyltransferase
MTQQSLMKLHRAIIDQNSADAVEFTKDSIAQGVDEREIIETVAVALKEVGDLFERCDLFLPEVMRAANAAKASLSLVLNAGTGTAKGSKNNKGTIAIGSLGPHDIGKTIVIAKLIADGFDLIDMGTSVSPQKAEKIIAENEVDVLALSILLTSDIDKASEVILRAKAIKGALKVMVGGAAMNENTSKRIGSDAYGVDAGAAVTIANGFMDRGG